MAVNKGEKLFDAWVMREEKSRERPPFMVEAIKRIGDGAYGALLAARMNFGDAAKPEHALKILELALAEREKLEAAAQAEYKKALKAARKAKKAQ